MAPTLPTTLAHDLRRFAAAQERVSDAHLLAAFAQSRDEAAFAALVRRHAGLVMGVCRRVLQHTQDAEDAFQATFLVLARDAGRIRRHEVLSAWLHGVAHRVASNSKRQLARQRRRNETPRRPEATSDTGDLMWREVQGLLDEEVARLPEIYRTVFVACCLEEKTKPEAARILGLKEGTVSSRLAHARRRLQERLTKRGVTLAALLAVAHGGVSASTIAATVRAALAVEAVRSTASRLLVAATLLIGIGALFAPLAAQATKPEEKGKAGAAKTELEKERTVAGVVLDAAGKPVPGASVVGRVSSPGRHAGESAAAARTDAAGRFRLMYTTTDHHAAVVVATAEGYGMAWADPTDKPMTLRLPKDQEVVGKVVDLEGRVVKDARVRVTRIDAPMAGDLATQLTAYPLGRSRFRSLAAPLLPGPAAAFAADDKGRVRLTGLGHDRLITAVVEGPTIASTEVWVYTTAAAMPKVAKYNPIYQATFTHVAAPTRVVVGVVRDRVTKQPIAGVTVRSTRLAGQFWYGSGYASAVTDADGKYRLVGLPKGRGNWVTVEPPLDQPHLGVTVEIPDPVGGEPVAFDLDLRPGVWAHGRVRDRGTGNGLPFAAVQYYASVGNRHLGEVVGDKRGYLFNPPRHADADGRFRLPVLPGEGAVVTTAGEPYVTLREQSGVKPRDLDAFVPHSIAAGVYHRLAAINPPRDAGRVACDLDLDKGDAFTARLVGPDGKPVTGTYSRGARAAWGGWVGPNETDTLRLAGINPSKPRPVYLVQPERNLVGVVKTLPEKKDFVVKLEKGGTITGRLVDAAGKPRAGVRVTVEARVEVAPFYGAYALYDGEAKTDAAGAFRFTGVLPGAEHLIRAYGEAAIGRYTLAAGEVRELGQVKVRSD